MSRGAPLLLALAAPGVAYAGAWVPEPGHGYADLQAVIFPGGTRTSGSGEPMFQVGAYGYAEVGVAGQRVAALLKAPLYVHTWLPERDEHNGGLGDLAAGLRLGLVTGAWPVALEAWASFPTGEGEGQLPTGFGTWGVRGGAYLGHGFDKGWWGQAGVLGEWFERYGAALRVEVGAGKDLGKGWSLDGMVIFRVGFGPAPADPLRALYRGDEAWGTLNARVRRALGDLFAVYAGLDVGLYSRNAPFGVPISVGVSAKW